MGQEATQDPCWCEVADEPVVVLNTQPVKASNGVEGKTERIIGIEFDGAYSRQKRYVLRRGEVLFKRMNSVNVGLGFTSISTEVGTARLVKQKCCD